MWIGLVALATPLVASPSWVAPTQVKLGELQILELRETDPALSAPPRPVLEDRLGSLRIRSLEPLPDGRGWRFHVQALEPGVALVPALDLGNGQRSPELRLTVPRTMPYGGPWVGFGGGNEDRLPAMPFPWFWASLLLLPLPLLAVWLGRRWGRGAQARRFHRSQGAFRKAWPPRDGHRETLDALHHLGRELLALRFGDQARAWGPEEFQSRNLRPWDQWVKSLDAARFGRTEPPFPPSQTLLAALDARSDGRPRP
jgi:hypothetical protein